MKVMGAHIFDAVPRDHVALRMRRPKDGGLQARIALGLEVAERRAAAHRVEDEAQGLLLRQCGVHLSEAICGGRSSAGQPSLALLREPARSSGSLLFERK